MAMCRPGAKYRDVGEVVTRHASNNGLSVVSNTTHTLHQSFIFVCGVR
jgi:methionine aminopeptidase